jgi:hypothetical protein
MNHPHQLVPPPQQQRPAVAFLVTLFVLTLVTSGLAFYGWDFYRLGLADRVVHPMFQKLKPSGLVGHGYGMVGTALILTNLLYLVRRRLTRAMAWAGSVRAWLNMHVFTGLVGSVLILYHSAFQLRTPIATVTSVSLAIVVGTGLVGLYLHVLVPKEGLKPLNERLTEIEPLLPGLVAQVRQFVAQTPLLTLPADASFLRTILTIPRWAMQAARRRRGLHKAARQDKMFRVLERTDKTLARSFYKELGLLAASEVDTHVGAALMRTWRSLHRFLALLMIISVTVHIGVAWFYGFRWIFE